MSKKQERTNHTICNVCHFKAESGKKLTFHIKSVHGLKAEEYTALYICGGKRPLCPSCGSETRYVAFTFKEFCKEHSSLAEAKAGAKGGKNKKQWNKGQTIETDLRILKTTKYGVENSFYGKQHTDEAKRSNADKHRLSEEEFTKRVNIRPDRFLCLSSYADYRYRQGQKLLFRCLGCYMAGRDTVIQHTLINFERNPICRICHPGGSKEQFEIADFIRSLGLDVVYNDRDAIAPKELDIYVPSKRFAVEYDSFYYHSWSDDDPREDRHHVKSTLCWNNDIDIIHVFQDEWRDKRPIVESMIMHRLGLSGKKLHARKCTVRPMDIHNARVFFDANHIAGYSRATFALGLYEHDVLVAAISFRKPFQKKYAGRAEICRYACTLGTSVVGGLGKLLATGLDECKHHGFIGVMTYADLRYGRGLGYEKVGFKRVGWTGLSYDYNDGHRRYGRLTVTAVDGMTERQVAESRGLKRIYGCGSNIYLLD